MTVTTAPVFKISQRVTRKLDGTEGVVVGIDEYNGEHLDRVQLDRPQYSEEDNGVLGSEQAWAPVVGELHAHVEEESADCDGSYSREHVVAMDALERTNASGFGDIDFHNRVVSNAVNTYSLERTDAWHRLGTTLEESFTAEQAMQEGNLGGWDVRKVPVTAEVGLHHVPIPDRFAVIRDNPVRKGQVDALGVVGEGYTIVQNEDHAAFLNALVDESGAHFETAGALYGGRQVFITMKLPSSMKIGGVDAVDTYIAAINSHDGSKAFTVMPTPVRIVCANTLNLAWRGATTQFRVRHTSGAQKGMVSKAREMLDLTFGYLDRFQAEAEQLINTTLTQKAFEELIAREFGAPEEAPAATVTRCDNKIDQMTELFAEAQTQDGIRNTAWAGLNALTEWADHFAPTRGGGADDARAQRAILEPSFKNKARELMLAV